MEAAWWGTEDVIITLTSQQNAASPTTSSTSPTCPARPPAAQPRSAQRTRHTAAMRHDTVPAGNCAVLYMSMHVLLVCLCVYATYVHAVGLAAPARAPAAPDRAARQAEWEWRGGEGCGTEGGEGRTMTSARKYISKGARGRPSFSAFGFAACGT